MAENLYKEIAVEPEVMAQWDWFLVIHEMFGFEKGRLLAEFPGKWRRMVMQRAEELMAEGKNPQRLGIMLIEVLRSDEFRAGLYSCGRQPDAEASTWIEKAQKQDPPFDVIVSEHAAGGSSPVIRAEFGFWKNPLFEGKRQCRVPRNAPELVGAPEKLLRKAREIRLIDQYFSPEDNGLLTELLKFLHKSDSPCRRVDVFTVVNLPKFNSMDQKWREEAIKKRYRAFSTNFEKIIPKGLTVCVHFLTPHDNGENLHPRFLLTDAGGLHYDYGLDEGDGTTIVSILDEEFRQQLWDEYSPETTTFARHESYPTVTIGG